MTPRETYHHGDLRAALVAEGLKQLEAVGEGAVSLRALSKAVGVSPNAPYRHFVDKNALMGALAAEGFARFADGIEGAGADGLPPLAALKAQGRAYLKFATDHPALYRLMFSPYGYSLHSDQCQNHATRAFGSLVASVAHAQQAGWKPTTENPTAVLAFWSALHGWASLCGDHLIPPGVPIPGSDEWLNALV